jgi:hypothetical protein
MMDAAGLIPDKTEQPPIITKPPPLKPPRVIKGQELLKNERKSEALSNMFQPPREHEVPEAIEAFADMSLRQIIKRFGTEQAFVDWLKAGKEIEAIEEKRLKNAEKKGQLVNRELVKRGIIEPIDSMHIKLLTDGAKTLSRRVTTMHDSGETVETIEKFIAEHITSFIRPVKSKVARALKNV